MAAKGKSRVKVEGVREVQGALKEVAQDARDLSAAHKAVASALVPGVAMATPRRSGQLAASWKAGATKTRARLDNRMPYAGVIEWGWPARGIEGAHMAVSTIEANTREIVEAYEQEIARIGAAAGFEVKR